MLEIKGKKVFINGEDCNKSVAYSRYSGSELSFWVEEEVEKIMRDELQGLSIDRFKSHIYNQAYNNLISEVCINFQKNKVEFQIQLKSSENWAMPWSQNQYCWQLAQVGLRLSPNVHFEIEGYNIQKGDNLKDTVAGAFFCNQYCAVFQYEQGASLVLSNLLEDFGPLLQKIHNEAIAELKAGLDPDSLSVFFDFPKSFETNCSQYLHYFGKFLEEQGIDNELSLSKEDGQTLLKVTPKDKDHALEEIGRQLTLYMGLSDIDFSTAQSEKEVELLQLQSQVSFFKGQFESQRGILQAKDAHIKSLEHRAESQESSIQALTASQQSSQTHLQREHSNLSECLTDSFKTARFNGKQHSKAGFIKKINQGIKTAGVTGSLLFGIDITPITNLLTGEEDEEK